MSAAAELLREAHERYRDAIGTPRETVEWIALKVTTRLVQVAARSVDEDERAELEIGGES